MNNSDNNNNDDDNGQSYCYHTKDQDRRKTIAKCQE